MDVYAIRLKRIREVIADKFSGNKGRFADAIGRKRPNIYRILSATTSDPRAIGEALARDIETRLGLPTGYLDHEGGVRPEAAAAMAKLTADEDRLLHLWRPLFQDQKDEFLAKLETEAERARRIEAELTRRGFDKFVPDQEVGKHIKPRPAQRELPLPVRESTRGAKRSSRGK